MKSCALCGITDPSVRIGLVEWRVPIDGERFSAVPRCPDRNACRARIEAAGSEWELAEQPERVAS